MNISNNLKNKVINNKSLTEEETNSFLKFIIHKAIIITNHMYNTINYLPIYLFHEICYSYNLKAILTKNKDSYHSIITLNNKKYLVDLNFNNNKIKYLKDNKYIEYKNEVYDLYLKITGDDYHE